MAISGAKIPFDYGLFFGAILHWIGRDPDRKTRLGDDGYYDYLVLPKRQTRRGLAG